MTKRTKKASKVDGKPADKAVELTDAELDDVAAGAATNQWLEVFTCPDDADDEAQATIKDGTSNTFMVGERRT